MESIQDYGTRMERVEKNKTEWTRQSGETPQEIRATNLERVKYRGEAPPGEKRPSSQKHQEAAPDKSFDPTELERFKTEINLSEYAASKGYRLSPKESYRNVAVMRSDDGGKINVTVKDGHYLYYDWRTERGGSIIDFVQNTQGASIGQVRKELRPWIGEDSKPSIDRDHFQKKIEPMVKDQSATFRKRSTSITEIFPKQLKSWD